MTTEPVSALRAENRDLREVVRQLQDEKLSDHVRHIRLARRDGEANGLFQDIVFLSGTQSDRQKESRFTAEKIAEPLVLAFDQDGQWYYCPCESGSNGPDYEVLPCDTCTTGFAPARFHLKFSGLVLKAPFDTDFYLAQLVTKLTAGLEDGGFFLERHEEPLSQGCIWKYSLKVLPFTFELEPPDAVAPEYTMEVTYTLFNDTTSLVVALVEKDTLNGAVYNFTRASTEKDCQNCEEHLMVFDGLSDEWFENWLADVCPAAPGDIEELALANLEVAFAATANTVRVNGHSGGNTIAEINGPSAKAGNEINCIFNDSLVTVSHDDSGDKDTVDLKDKVDFISSSEKQLRLVHDGVSWTQTGETVPILSDKQIITLGSGVTTFAATGKQVVMTGDASGNTLATIGGDQAFAGNQIAIRFEDSLVTITNNQSHTTNSVALHRDFIGSPDGVLTLQYDGVSWYEVTRSNIGIESITLGSGVTSFDATATTILLTGNAGVQPDIDTINGPRAVGGEDIYIFFQDALTDMSEIAEATNTLKLSADFTAADNMVMHLHHDGARWYEVVKTGT